MRQKLLVISIDSMVEEDAPILLRLPHFRRLLKESSWVRHMESTYPTLTHSVHTGIITGCYPGRHGIIGNEQFIPGNFHAPWYEDASCVKVDMLPEQAAEHGYTTAYVCWPLTKGAKADWILHRAGMRTPPEERRAVMERLSTPELVAELPEDILRSWEYLPHFYASDRFSFRAGAWLYRTHQPDILYMHIILVDHIRHQYGVFDPEVEKAYRFLDEELGQLLCALDETGLYDRTIINLTSDHGHLDVSRVVSLNRFFREQGYLRAAGDGTLLSWSVYAHACALSAQIYIQNRDQALCRKIRALLEENREQLGIERVFTAREAADRYRLWGEFDLVAETDGITAFSSDYTLPLETATDDADYRYSRATHGHLPEKGPQPTFFLRNPYGEQVVLERGRIVDQAPTLARLLGFSLSGCDGTPICELTEGRHGKNLICRRAIAGGIPL